MTDEELEKVARAATPGPWGYDLNHTVAIGADEDEWGMSVCQSPSGLHRERPDVQARSDLTFIAAFNPATALALLERVRGAESALTTSMKVAKEWCDRAVKAERPSHPTGEHSQRVVTALEEMLAPLSDGTLGNRDVVGRVSALLDRMTKAEARVRELEEVAREVESLTADAAENGNCADCPYVPQERARELLALIRKGR